MPMPTAASKANCDASTDDPKLAILTDLAALIDKFNDLIAMRAAASGYCDLDSSTLVPSARLATALAAIYALTPAADRIPYFTSASAAALLTIGTASGNVPLVGTSSATELLAGLVELNTSAETITGTDTTRATHAAGVKAAIDAAITGPTLGTPAATTSGTAVDYTGLPAGTKRITVNFNGVSLSGTSNILVQLGDAGGIETTSYTSVSGWNITGTTLASSTAGVVVTSNGTAAVNLSGSVVFSLLNSTTNTWVCCGVLVAAGTTAQVTVSGIKALSAELTQLRITSVNGTDTFDLGSVNIIYE